MTHDEYKLNPLEWIAAIVWIAFWDVLAYKAITEKVIGLGGRFGISNFSGFPAVMIGLALIGVSLAGVFWLMRLNPNRTGVNFLVMLAWVGGSIIYLVYFYH